jgi:phosphoribosyl-ATP pyrophosphohydrolase
VPEPRESVGALRVNSSILSELSKVLTERKANPPTKPSYVAGLLRGGMTRIGAKIIEEAAEVVEAGDEPGDAGRDHLVKEAADLLFHMMVLLTHRDIAWPAVEAELARRFGIGGIEEKQSRTQSEITHR